MKTKIKILLLILSILTLGYCKVKEPDITFYESVKRKLETPEEKEARRVAENAARDEAAKRSFAEAAAQSGRTLCAGDAGLLENPNRPFAYGRQPHHKSKEREYDERRYSRQY